MLRFRLISDYPINNYKVILQTSVDYWFLQNWYHSFIADFMLIFFLFCVCADY